MGSPPDDLPDWERLLAAERHLQHLVPGAIFVGGSAAAELSDASQDPVGLAEDQHGTLHSLREVDLLLRVRNVLVPIEIKLGLTPPDTRSLESCMHALSLPRGYVVNLSTRPVEIRRGVWMCGLVKLLQRWGSRRAREDDGFGHRVGDLVPGASTRCLDGRRATGRSNR